MSGIPCVECRLPMKGFLCGDCRLTLIIPCKNVLNCFARCTYLTKNKRFIAKHKRDFTMEK